MYYFCEEGRKEFDHKVAPNTRLRTHVSVFCAIFTEIYFFRPRQILFGPKLSRNKSYLRKTAR